VIDFEEKKAYNDVQLRNSKEKKYRKHSSNKKKKLKEKNRLFYL